MARIASIEVIEGQSAIMNSYLLGIRIRCRWKVKRGT